MADLQPIPQYRHSLGDFVGDLRNAIFSSQQKTADHFQLNRSTISHYEGGKHQYQPKVGFIAQLATLFVTKHKSDEASQATLLNEVNKTIRQCYEYEKPFRDWSELVGVGNAYIEERSKNDLVDRKHPPKPESYNSPKRFWGDSPDVSEFVGRESELEILKQWSIEEHARMIGVVGIGGVGKTTFAKKAATEVADHFEHIVWYSLRFPNPVEETIGDLIHFLSSQNSDNALLGLNQLLDQLMHFLKNHRCLLIIDNAETILAEGRYAGRYLSKYKDYRNC